LFPESDVPAQWRYARSNGVAIHDGWRAAALRALWELAERDRVLRAWYGDTRPARVDLPIDDTPLAGASSFDWVAYSFPSPSPENFSAGVEVVGVFGFPDRDTLPVISGFGGRPNWQEAHAAAVSEAMQLLGFLWGEPVAEEAPSCGPTPLHHLDYYQWPPHRAHLRRWLELGHERFLPARLPEPGTPVMFADLTPAWLESGLRVAKAICDSAAPLTFGDSPFACHLPSELRPHPVA
jgi:ribosomal protein S12 methylthiotransferase accessory factor YcaO